MRRGTELATGISSEGAGAPTATLTFDQRRRSRQRLVLDDGEELALLLPRGTVLRDGDRVLVAEADGTRRGLVTIAAAPEPLSTVVSTDPFLLCRAAYHLGNRHVPLQLEPGRLAYQHDHVLDDLVRALGIEPCFARAPFQPEPGPYGQEAAHGQHARGHHHHDDEHDDGDAHADGAQTRHGERR